MVELAKAMASTQESYRHDAVLPYLPHVQAVVGLLPGGDRWGIGDDELDLVEDSSRTAIEGDQPDSVVRLIESMLDASEDLETTHPLWYARVLKQLAIAWEQLGHLDRSMQAKQRVHEIFARERGERAPATITALDNIAVAHSRSKLRDLP
ncbi:hypothetical protein GCM10029992_08020 [Glycomyces albus]